MICDVCEIHINAADAIIDEEFSTKPICPNCYATYQAFLVEEMAALEENNHVAER